MPDGDSIKLNIGAGDTEIDGFTSIDVKKHGLAFPLMKDGNFFDDESVDEIRASHILEHFPFKEVKLVLADWVRVLKDGGTIRIAVPDMAKIIDMSKDDADPMWPKYLMGGQTDDNDFHKSVFTEDMLRALLEEVGIYNIEEWEADKIDTASHEVSLRLMGTKCKKPEKVILPRIEAVISMPRLAFTDNLFCALPIMHGKGITLMNSIGAYWAECLERVMMDAIKRGAEWLFTMDYDTVFTSKTVDDLCGLMYQHPDADAIAPLQMKRDGDTPMIWDLSEDGTPKKEWFLTDFDPLLTKVRHAHFGLTLFRVDALKRMAHPWFLAKPDENGEWGEGRQDADIAFWEKWITTGNTLYLANHVPIGHMQLMVTWPTEAFKTTQQYMADFREIGPPEDVRK